MPEMSARWLLIVCFLLGMSSLMGQAITVSADVDTNQIRIGEPIQLTIEAQTDTQTSILWPTFSGNIQDFELLNESDEKITVIKDSAIFTKLYTITSFSAGDQVLEPIAIPFRMTVTGAVDSISTNPIDITVHTVEIDTTQPFKPIKAPVEYPLTWRDYWPYILGGILLIALVIFFIWWWKKREKPATAVEQIKETKRPAHEVAIEELLKLEQQGLWQKGEVKAYHDQLSDIVRAYIEERYQIPALESTTDELSKKMRSTDLREDQLNDLLQILSVADLAKFAKVEPSRDENLGSMDKAKHFIETTRPDEKESGA